MITVLVEPADLAGERLELVGDRYHHLVRVRRAGVGSELRLVDGAGGARQGRIDRIDRRSAGVLLGAPAPGLEPRRHVELLVAPPRPERASWMVEKATELGVAAVRFVATERDPRSIGEGNLERLRRVAAAALEQCGGCRLPALSGVHAFAELPSLLADLPRRLCLDFGGEPFPAADDSSLALLVGPEGGWTAGERATLAELGCVAIALGQRVLRVETAALAAATLAFHSGAVASASSPAFLR